MHRVLVYQQAKDDLLRNARWWAKHHSVDQALAWLDAVESQIESLSELPERFAVAPENRLFKYEIRQFLVGAGSSKSYRAIYTISNGTVHVLTVRRAEQDNLAESELPSELRS